MIEELNRKIKGALVRRGRGVTGDKEEGGVGMRSVERKRER